MSLHTLILAAGEGRRFGDAVKQLAVVRGCSLLEACLALATEVTPNKVSVVLGCHHLQLSSLIRGAEIVINSHWQEGIGSSIACGVNALPSSASAVLILLCDQAALTAADLMLLCDRFHNLVDEKNPKATIVCAAYAGGVGVPAIFPRHFFSQLMALNGDVGAKKLLLNNPVVSIPLERAAIDIDTQQDWLEFQLQQASVKNQNKTQNTIIDEEGSR